MNKFIKYFNKFRTWKYKDPAVLTILFFIAIFLRAYLIDKNLFFGPEQGRDMLVVKDIVLGHRLVLLGPKTAIDGVFHGPLYYYVSVIPFLLGKGNPLVISYFFIILNALTVFLIYLLGKEVFNRRIAMLCAILFTVSFGCVVMSRWLSHPPLILPFSCLFFLSLTKFLKGNNKFLIPTAIAYGICSQTEFSDLIIFSFVIVLVAIFFFKKFIKQNIFNLGMALMLVIFLPVGNFILFDLRHQFLITKSFLKSQQHRPEFLSYLTHTLLGSASQFSRVFSDLVLPFDSIFGLLLFICALISMLLIFKKYSLGIKVLLIWIFSPFVAFILLKYNPLYHYFAASFIALIFLTGIMVSNVIDYKKSIGFVVLFLLIFANFAAWLVFLPDNANVFFQSTQPYLRYKDQQSTIDRIYKDANGSPFFYQAYTIPYWLQEGWQYLFWYQGEKFGYQPKQTDNGLLYVIIQKDYSGKLYQDNWLKDTVSKWGIKQGQFVYGDLTVQRRYVR